ncbi:MBL fold metallo-hydrolase [Nocardia australiensis]|uniref:MBL fold metallo-hydrolase n=1 Tax=Nocardia australiensis TaxID=2887191 RepID=UPI001D13D4EB|nr:MBL fold metallo-hydrolase [Nocardia australiensis]
MRVHHLNCGSMREIEGPVGERSAAVCHCLLVETEQGLVLVDTGIGLHDIADPPRTLGSDFVSWARPVLDPAETAIRQVEALGYDVGDVRDIVMTHLHLDHAGALADFPEATVHVSATELKTATTADRYPHQQWAHGPRWAAYDFDEGDIWNGFENVRPAEGLPSEILLVPLPGHTDGHLGVAVACESGWLLHAGDSYYYHGELASAPAPAPDMLEALQSSTETDRELRLANVRQLSSLAASGVRVFCAHDPWEFRDALRG